MKKWILAGWLIASMAFADSALITKVIQLNYLNTKETMETLKPLLQPQESITLAGDNKILVNVQPDTLTKIRDIIHQLDVPPITFQITIHQGDENWLQQANSGDTNYNSGDPLVATDTQSVSVMNNQWAVVNTGSNVPVVSSVQGGFWGPGVSYERMNVDKGFLIHPTMQGSKVNVKIRRVNQQQDLINSQNINGQNIDTTMMVPLNKWVKLGGTSQNDVSPQSNQTNYNAGNKFDTKTTLYIKITRSDDGDDSDS